MDRKKVSAQILGHTKDDMNEDSQDSEISTAPDQHEEALNSHVDSLMSAMASNDRDNVKEALRSFISQHQMHEDVEP